MRLKLCRFRWFVSSLALALFWALSPATILSNNLVWNDATGNFVGSGGTEPWSFNNGGTLATTDNPFTHIGAGGSLGGENVILIGAGGDVTLDTPGQGPFSDNSLYEIRVGTNANAANLTSIGGTDLRGDGTLTIDNVDLILFDTDGVGTGRLIVGGASGITGTVNWNSSGTLTSNGHLRIGQSGTGSFNQNGGTIVTGNTSGGGNKDMHIGNGGGSGTYHLNDGSLQLGASDDGIGLEANRTLQIGFESGSTGVFNIGDGMGAAQSASFESWGPVIIGNTNSGGSGVINIQSDGALRVNYAPLLGQSSPVRVGPHGGESHGTINQQGGVLDIDGLLELGFNTGTGIYNLVGSTGTVNVRAVTALDRSQFAFTLDAGGATPIIVEGNTNTAGDIAAGNSVSLSNPTLVISGLDDYLSTDPIVLFDQLDPTASLSGRFGNLIQGEEIGTNVNGSWYLNYFGGDGNDIVLQNSLPSSSTDGLVWTVGTANFDAGWSEGDGNFGALPPGSDPFAGLRNLYLANGGNATYDGTTDDLNGSAVQNLYIGTNRAAAIVADTNGDGVLTVSGSENLTIDDSGAQGAEGMLFVGEAGFSGTLNWNSSGTLDVQGHFRVGRNGGTGVVNQNGGTVQSGTTGGSGKYMAIGEFAGSNGTYNLNEGTLLPDGPGAGSPTRQVRVGIQGATGVFNLGDGVGAPGTSLIESEDDLWIGRGTGHGTLSVAADGEVRLLGGGAQLSIGATPESIGVLNVDNGSISVGDDMFVGELGGTGTVNHNGGLVTVTDEFFIGSGSESVGEYNLSAGTLAASHHLYVGERGGTGTVNQTSGSVTINDLFTIGQGSDAAGEYNLSGGSVTGAADGGGATRIGANGGDGTFRVSGTGSFSTSANLVIGQNNNSGATGLLELVGSAASFQVANLQVHNRNNQTISWIADENGITPIVIAGSGQLQANGQFGIDGNTGTNGNGDLMGDGTALLLDLSALSGDQQLTLIDNQGVDPIQGFFENGTSLDLYEEGEQILGTGFAGSVTISYLGGTGNDIILDLVAGAALVGDYNEDGTVDAADYVVWRRTGINGQQGYTDWRSNFGATAGAGSGSSAGAVPEPTGFVLMLLAVAGASLYRGRSMG